MIYGIPTGWAHEELDRCIGTIKKFDNDYEIIILNNNPNNHEVKEVLTSHIDDKTWIVHESANIGVAAAWNKLSGVAWKQGYDRIILLNDDIYFTSSRYIPGFKTHKGLVACRRNDFACFCISRETFQRIGPFDEANYAYFEDNDYAYRARLLGVEIQYVDTDSLHGDGVNGSTTIRKDEYMRTMNNHCFPIAERYYIAKWGGHPGQETFVVPFNGADPVNGSVHEWQNRLS